MLTFIFMIAFSLYLGGYGFIALFKPEWLMKIRSLSAKIEGKGDLKHEDIQANVGQARKIMAIASLIFGLIGLIISIATMVIYIQAQSGTISV